MKQFCHFNSFSKIWNLISIKYNVCVWVNICFRPISRLIKTKFSQSSIVFINTYRQTACGPIVYMIIATTHS